MQREPSEAADVACYSVKIQAFPLNIHLYPDSDRPPGAVTQLDDAFGDLLIREESLYTLSYNAFKAIVAEIDGPGLRGYCGNEVGELEASCGYHPMGARLLFPGNGAVIVIVAFEMTSASASVTAEEIEHRGAVSFRAIQPLGRLVHDIAAHMEQLGMVECATPIRYEILDYCDRNSFCEHMAWRAWGSEADIAIGPGAKNIDWPYSKGRGGGEELVENDPRTRTIVDNTLGFVRPEIPSSAGMPALQRLVEPIGFLLCQRSLSSSALRNLREISANFADGKRVPLTADELQRYVTLVRTNLMGLQVYEESSDKSSRRVYRFMYDHLAMDRVSERLEQAMTAIATSIHGLEAVQEARFQRRLSLLVIFFTALTFVSLATDVGSFVYAQESLAFVYRVTAVGVALVLSGAVFGIVAWRFRRNRSINTTRR